MYCTLKTNHLCLFDSGQRLKSACAEASEPFSGIFIGFENDQELFVHGHYSFEQSNPKYLVKQLDEAISLLPIG